MEYIKPTTFNIVWADVGVSTAPSNTKYQTGWVPEKPPYQTFNYILNKFDTMLNHLNQTGIVEWDNQTEYQANKSYIRLANKVYFCKQTHTNQNPSTDLSETYWRPILDGTKLLADAAVSSFMKTVLDDANGQLALQTMGVTSTGYSIVTASNTSNAQTAMGGTTVGKAVFIASSEANARTAIGVVAATEATAGIMEIATSAELNTGTDDTRAISPLKAKLGFSISLTTNGHFHFPSWLGGLQIKWGVVSVDDNNLANTNANFTTACLGGVVSLGHASATTDYNPPSCAPLGNDLIIYNSDSSSITARYIAIGY